MTTSAGPGDAIRQPLSVWDNLPPEQRAFVLRLLTELAYALVTATPSNSTQEICYVPPSPPRQDSTRTP